MAGMNMQVKVDDELVLPIVESEIQAAIVRQLSNIPDLIPRMIRAVLNEKVDGDGEPGGYYAKTPYIEWLFDESIKRAVKKAVEEYVSSQETELQTDVAREIEKQRAGLAQAFVKGLADSVSTKWTFNLEVKTPREWSE